MNEQVATSKRIFRIGDPGIPEEGIIIGRGGGFTSVYDDLVLLPDGDVQFMTYMVEDGAPIPEDRQSVRLLIADEGQQLRHFIKQLERIGFHSISLPFPTSTIINYLVLVQKDEGLHAVEWAFGSDDAAPAELLATYRSIRDFIAKKFAEIHGV